MNKYLDRVKEAGNIFSLLATDIEDFELAVLASNYGVSLKSYKDDTLYSIIDKILGTDVVSDMYKASIPYRFLAYNDTEILSFKDVIKSLLDYKVRTRVIINAVVSDLLESYGSGFPKYKIKIEVTSLDTEYQWSIKFDGGFINGFIIDITFNPISDMMFYSLGTFNDQSISSYTTSYR